jgi:hypothetical protein
MAQRRSSMHIALEALALLQLSNGKRLKMLSLQGTDRVYHPRKCQSNFRVSVAAHETQLMPHSRS